MEWGRQLQSLRSRRRKQAPDKMFFFESWYTGGEAGECFMVENYQRGGEGKKNERGARTGGNHRVRPCFCRGCCGVVLRARGITQENFLCENKKWGPFLVPILETTPKVRKDRRERNRKLGGQNKKKKSGDKSHPGQKKPPQPYDKNPKKE